MDKKALTMFLEQQKSVVNNNVSLSLRIRPLANMHNVLLAMLCRLFSRARHLIIKHGSKVPGYEMSLLSYKIIYWFWGVLAFMKVIEPT